jgi:hypothetical protein
MSRKVGLDASNEELIFLLRIGLNPDVNANKTGGKLPCPHQFEYGYCVNNWMNIGDTPYGQ